MKMEYNQIIKAKRGINKKYDVYCCKNCKSLVRKDEKKCPACGMPNLRKLKCKK